MRAPLKFLVVAAALSLGLAACGSSDSIEGTALPRVNGQGMGLEYGTDDYSAARIKLYEESGAVPEGEALTAEHLPWDPNGPTIPVGELKAALVTATRLDTVPESRDGYILFDSNMDALVTGAQDACSGKLTEYEGGEVVDEILMYLRFGSNIGSTPVDGNGGIDCGDGTVIGGTGENIFADNDPDEFGTYDNGEEVPPLTP